MPINCEENTLECQFISTSTSYGCLTTDGKLSKNILKVTGDHNPFKSNSDVKFLTIESSKFDDKIPQNLGNFFPNLMSLNITNSNNLTKIDKEDFRNLSNLEIFTLNFTQIQNLTENLFQFTPKLREIYIQNSLIKFVNFHTFDGLEELKILKFNSTCGNVDFKSRNIENLIDDVISQCPEIGKIFCFYETNQKDKRYGCRVKRNNGVMNRNEAIGEKFFNSA